MLFSKDNLKRVGKVGADYAKEETKGFVGEVIQGFLIKMSLILIIGGAILYYLFSGIFFIGEKVGEAKDATVAYVSEKKENVNKSIGEVKEKMTEKKDNAINVVAETKDKSIQAIIETKDNSVKKMNEVKEISKEKLESLKDESLESIKGASDLLKSKWTGLKESTIGTEKNEEVIKNGENEVQEIVISEEEKQEELSILKKFKLNGYSEDNKEDSSK